MTSSGTEWSGRYSVARVEGIATRTATIAHTVKRTDRARHFMVTDLTSGWGSRLCRASSMKAETAAPHVGIILLFREAQHIGVADHTQFDLLVVRPFENNNKVPITTPMPTCSGSAAKGSVIGWDIAAIGTVGPQLKER